MQEERIFNCTKSTNTESDWKIENLFKFDDEFRALQAPESIDLREDWWTIGNQKSTGSCVGWATADSILRWYFVKNGKLPDNIKLSPRFIWMASKETDLNLEYPTTFIEECGTSIKTALRVAKKFGCVQEWFLPFEGPRFNGLLEHFYMMAAIYQINCYFNLGILQKGWKIWLANRGPILARLHVDKSFREPKPNGNIDNFNDEGTNKYHAIALVGYTKDNRFIIRNSWGNEWGDKGYAYASEEYLKKAIVETYGVCIY